MIHLLLAIIYLAFISLGLPDGLLGAAWLPLGKIAACVVAWVVRLVVAIAGAVAQLPVSAVYTQSIYIIARILLCYQLLAVFLLALE